MRASNWFKLVLLFLCPLNLYAQSESALSSIMQSLNSAFEDLDYSHISTGYLRDKALDLVGLSAYTGYALTDSNYVELRDSAYVQTLTEEDMRNLHIAESERAFGEGYVVQLNELLKEK